MPRELPKWMHFKHGAYYFVRHNKWTFLSRDKREALRLYADMATVGYGSGMCDLIERALDDMKLTVAKSTYKHYRTCAVRAEKSFKNYSPAQVKPKDVAAFLDMAKDKPSMANLMRSFLKGVFNRGVRWGECDANPVTEIKPFKVRARSRYITDEEYAEIRKHASPTMQCLMDIAYITGQRKGDVMGIRYADISEKGLYVEQKKTKARVLIAMTPDLEAAIQRARELHKSVKGLTLFHRPDGSPLSDTTMYGHWKRACEKAKVEGANFHDLRAASATDAKAQGLDSRALLGHTTESSHNRYLRSKEVPVAQPVPARKKRAEK